MSGNLKVTLGQDLSCYAEIEIPADSDLSPENLARIANDAVDDDGVVFDEDWSTCCALRVVDVRNSNNESLVQDVVVEPSPFDVGQQLSLFLGGKIEWSQLLQSASAFGLIQEVETQFMTGYLTLPSEDIALKFQVRKGATQHEMDVAFFHALCQIGEVEYRPYAQEVSHG